MRTIGKRILTLAVVLTTLLAALAAPTPAYADDGAADRLAGLNAKIKALQTQQAQTNAKISAAKSEKEKQLVVKEQLIGQINNTLEQLDALTERAALLRMSIEIKNREMSAKQAEIDANFALLQKRIRAIYLSGGDGSTLGLVLGAESYSQFLMRSEVVTRVARHDQDLIAALKTEKAELKAIKETIEADKRGVEADQAAMDAKKTELGAQEAQVRDKIQSLAETEAAFMADKENLQKQMARMQNEIEAILAEINKNSANTQYVGGVMAWPSAGLTQISSEYGTRFSGSNFHTGIDIFGGGAYGSPVLAANSGTVAVANLVIDPYSYGKYVIIDHGGGIQTLYGHCSALNVKAGDAVAAGQKIAEVGSTGWSTGPHIHFEIRQNGKSVNPLSGNWLRG